MFQPPFLVWLQNVHTATSFGFITQLTRRDGIRPNTEGIKLLTDNIKQV